MKIQVLISTMNRDNCDFINKMNLSTDAIIGNQNGTEIIREYDTDFGHICEICSKEKGLSNNRNLTLKYATGDICLLADDDIIYIDNYDEVVQEEFQKHPDADILIFNLYEKSIIRSITKKEFRVNFFNYLQFGSVRIAFKRKSIVENNIKFDPNYGAGAKIPMGEDNIFIHDCLKVGLKIIAVPTYLLRLTNERSSTWFEGYDRKYFINKGALYRRIYPFSWRIICLQDIIRHRYLYNKSGKWLENFKLMILKG